MRRPKNILIANVFWDEEVSGGSYRIASDFARYLAGQGHSVHYLCGTKLDSYTLPEKRSGVQIWRYQVPVEISLSAFRFIQHFLPCRKLVSIIHKNSPIDILNGHSTVQYLSASSALPQNVIRRYSSHSPLPNEIEANSDDCEIGLRLKRLIATQFEKYAIRISDSIQSFSKFEASLLIQHYGDLVQKRLQIIPGWIDQKKFATSHIERSSARQKLPMIWKTEVPIFFCLRRLVSRMGIDYLIQAAAIIKKNGFIFRVLIGGEGSELKKLDLMIKKQDLAREVSLIRRVPEAELPFCYRAADCTILPTKTLECFGLTILESYAVGTPVIATPVGAIPEMMGAGLEGWLSHEISAEALADRMQSFLNKKLSVSSKLLQTRAGEFDIEQRAAALEKWLLESPNTL